jgi:hypothetical protein
MPPTCRSAPPTLCQSASSAAPLDPVPPAAPEPAPVQDGKISSLRLVALVILQMHPLKGNILPSQRDSPVQYQFSRTRRPLCHILHINNQHVGPTCHPLSPSSPSSDIFAPSSTRSTPAARPSSPTAPAEHLLPRPRAIAIARRAPPRGRAPSPSRHQPRPCSPTRRSAEEPKAELGGYWRRARWFPTVEQVSWSRGRSRRMPPASSSSVVFCGGGRTDRRGEGVRACGRPEAAPFLSLTLQSPLLASLSSGRWWRTVSGARQGVRTGSGTVARSSGGVALPGRPRTPNGVTTPSRSLHLRPPLLRRPRRRRPASSRSSSGPPLLLPSAAVLISRASGFARGRCSGRWWSPEQGVAHAQDVRCIWRIRAPCGTSRSPYRAPVRE